MIDLDTAHNPFVQLVIANVGTTIARDVRFSFDPPLQSSRDKEAKVPLASVSLFRDGIPTLPPGKTIAVLFDDVNRRREAQLPDRLEATITYRGEPFGRTFSDVFVLDIGMYRWWPRINRKDAHDIAVAVEKLREQR